jgi:regulator of sigma E protease
MFEIFTNLIAVLFVLGALVFIHEFGHYAAAKFFGVRVETFSIGFGKRLFGFRRGETDYRVSVLPLGGYVKMAGENPMEASTGDPGEFMAHPRWQRFVIALAGPVMNIALAFVLITGIFMTHYEHPYHDDQPATMGWVGDGSPAERAHLEAGDRIIKIENIENPTWQQVEQKEILSPGQPLNLEIQRGAQVFNVTVVPATVGPNQVGQAGWEPAEPNTVAVLDPKLPAAAAGIQIGDEIVSLNDFIVRSNSAVVSFLQKNQDKPLKVTLLRAGKEMTLNVTPALADVEGKKRYRIGVQFRPVRVDKLPFGQAVVKSFQWNKDNALLIFEMLKKLMERKASVKQMTGVVGMAQISGDAAREGWLPLLFVMAVISLNLGIFNLLPIPILDGGMIVMLCIEGLLRRDIKREIKELVYQAAFVFLLIFAAVVIYNDIAKTSVGHFLP